MLVFPPCKINLGLYITEKRSDGYHNLETCFYPIPFVDIIEIISADNLSFESTGLAIPGDPADNLCLKAYQLLKRDFDLRPVKIHLHKIIPTGAGLGGGSSDAAYTIRLLNEIFKLNLSTPVMMSYAANLGSDCSFFIQDNPMLGSGRGDVLSSSSATLKGFFLVLVKPPIHVSTAQAYASLMPRPMEQPIAKILATSPEAWRDTLTNDFEKTVFEKYPAISMIKDELYNAGAIYASMSGSGSTVFALFRDDPHLDEINDVPVLWKGFLP